MWRLQIEVDSGGDDVVICEGCMRCKHLRPRRFVRSQVIPVIVVVRSNEVLGMIENLSLGVR